MWITRIECIVMFHGHVWEEGMKHAEKMLGLAKKTKPNPIAPKDPDLKLYRMMRSMLEGELKTQKSSHAIHVSGEIADSASGKQLMDSFQSSAFLSVKPDDDADGSKPAKVAKPRVTKTIGDVNAEDKANAEGKGKGKG